MKIKLLSLVIPVYNEGKTIRNNLKIVQDYLKQQSFDYEIIVCNDGSLDNTAEEVTKSGVDLVFLNNQKNRGKGFVVKQGILKAEGEYVIFIDADLATPITELPKLLEPLKNNRADIVVGSRSIGKEDVERSLLRAFLGLGFRKLKSLILGIEIFDSQCGFKGFKKEVAQEVFSKQTIDGWSFDVEILAIASKLKYKILEVPVKWSEQRNSKLKLFSDVPKMFFELLKIKWRTRNIGVIK
jgi:dolichyl-phosphate beta-glucosyltransferase